MNSTSHARKLIEVALPLDEINAACKADKGRNIGTIRNIHKWFAPMPLPAWRALLFAALVDDPADDEKRAYLLDIIKRLVANGADLPDADTLVEARSIIETQFPEGVPAVLDPFCGGSSTLIEAQRLGLSTVGSDLNPVPVLIARTLTEILPKIYGWQPLHPKLMVRNDTAQVSSQNLLFEGRQAGAYSGYEGLTRDVAHYAEWIRDEAKRRLADYFPSQPGETPIAWLWARTARCPNPTCGVETILTTSWWLSRKAGDLTWLEPRVEDGVVLLSVVSGQKVGEPPAAPKVGRGAAFNCLGCGSVVDEDSVVRQGQGQGLGLRLTCAVVQRDGQRVYREPTSREVEAACLVPAVDDFPSIPFPDNPRWFSGPRFGLNEQADLYTRRQLKTLTTIADLVADTHSRVLADGGSRIWADAVTTLLGLSLGKAAQVNSSQAMIETCNGPTRFHSGFGRNDLPMTWDFFEPNLFDDEGPNWMRLVQTSLKSMLWVQPQGEGTARLQDARIAGIAPPGLVATDPPYFDAIGYADLSDYFYVWHRRALREVHPDLYTTLAAPKQGELTAVPSHHGKSRTAARDYFIQGFTETFENLQKSLVDGLPLLVVYASKEQKGGREEETRWSSILTAMVDSGLEVTGTWPIHGTGSRRLIGMGTNAVATYVVMASRPRSALAGSCSLADFNRALRRELKPAVHDLQAAGILPVDLAQAAMGPGMQIYSRYREVIDQMGERVGVDQALRLINAALGEVLEEQEGELDPYSRFAVAWWEKYGWVAAGFGEADQLARPQGIAVDDVIRAGVATYPRPGIVSLVGAKDLNRDWFPANDVRPTAWEAVHHLGDRLIDGGGVVEAGRLMAQLGLLRDPTQGLVYRLHAIAARKGRTKDQERYNALIGSWSDLLAIAATQKDGLF